MKAITQQKVMVPVELGISAQILAHRHGKPARLIFDYLLAQQAMRYGLDVDGYIAVSQARLEGLGIDTKARRRGLLALQELGLVLVRQEGQGSYRAKLLYQAPRTTRSTKASTSRVERADPPIDAVAYDLLRAMHADATDPPDPAMGETKP